MFANSKDVANFFGKQHGNVVRDIRVHVERLKGLQICNTPVFIEITEVNRQNGQTYYSYDMDKDAFTLLVMGYTGPAAMEFKLKYIERFNEMEQELKSQVPAVPTSFAEALQLAADQAVKIEHQLAPYDKPNHHLRLP